MHIVLLYTQRSKETDSSRVFLSTIYLQKLFLQFSFIVTLLTDCDMPMLDGMK